MESKGVKIIRLQADMIGEAKKALKTISETSTEESIERCFDD